MANEKVKVKIAGNRQNFHFENIKAVNSLNDKGEIVKTVFEVPKDVYEKFKDGSLVKA